MAPGYSIFRRTRGGKRADRYTIEMRLADGTTRHRVGYSDKGATQQLAAKWLREIERKEVGLHDPFGESRKAPILQHVTDFLRAMAQGTLSRRGVASAAWVEVARKRLTSMLRAMGAARAEQLHLEDAEQALAERQAAGWSAKTRDDHAALLRQFGGWLVSAKRLAANPFEQLRATRSASSKTFRRHALTVAELALLVEAAEVRPVQEGKRANPWMKAGHSAELQAAGNERAVLYQVAAYTGLRRGEVLALVWSDLHLGPAPAIALRGETAKNKQSVRLELPAWLGTLLEQLRVTQAQAGGAPVPGSALVFGASYRHITERLRLDALFARIGTEQVVGKKKRVVAEDGRVIDFHALRGTLATLAAELGMPPRLLQEHMRHSDVRLTMQVYAQVRSPAMRAAIDQLPAPRPVPAPGLSGPALTATDHDRPGETASERSGS
jgi:integrase